MQARKYKIKIIGLTFIFALIVCSLNIGSVLAEEPGTVDEVYSEPAGNPAGDTEGDPTGDPTSDPTGDPGGEPSEDPGSESSEPSDPSSEDPSSEPSEIPSSEPSDDPWSEPSEEPSDDPWSESSDDPWSESSEESWSDPVDYNTPSVAESPNTTPNTAGIIRPTPKPKNTSGSSNSSEDEGDSGPNYITFATVDVIQNALASNVFSAGIAFIGVGVAGLVALLILAIRNKKYRIDDEREGIFEEIKKAEARGNAIGGTGKQMVKNQESGSLRAVSGNIFANGSFENEAPSETISIPPVNPDEVPEDYYDEEFLLEDDFLVDEADMPISESPKVEISHTKPAAREVYNDDLFDTEEILREALELDDE